MANFISNLIARHTTAANYVLPRLRGRFEPQPGPATEAMPAYFPADAAPSADNIPAAANGLPEQPTHTPLPEQPVRKSVDPAAAPLVERTVAPPETLQPLLTPPATAQPAAYPSTNREQQPVMPANYPGPIPIPGTVNNLFAKHPPLARESGKAYTPSLLPEQEQPAASGSPYFSIRPPGQPNIALTVNNGPDRSMQRSGQFAAAAATPQQTIKVSIGRIDVRAVTQPAATKSGAAIKPAMTLDDFLKKRSGGTS